MTRRLITTGSSFEKEGAYSRVVVDGDWIFVAGTTGFDYAAGTIAEDAVEQVEQTFRNVAAALKQAGTSLDEVVRARYYITDVDEWPRMVPVCAKWFADVRPAATAIICGLVDPRMKFELEVTARRRAFEETASEGA